MRSTLEATVPRPKRQTHSLRAEIRAAIAKRIEAHQPLTIQAIKTDVGGGSSDTIRQELNLAMEENANRVLRGHAARNHAEREEALRAQLAQAQAANSGLMAEIEALRRALTSAAEPSEMMLQRFSTFESDLRYHLRTTGNAAARMIKEAERLQSVRETGVERVVEADPVTEARLQRTVDELMRLSARHERLRSLYFEKTGEFPDV